VKAPPLPLAAQPAGKRAKAVKQAVAQEQPWYVYACVSEGCPCLSSWSGAPGEACCVTCRDVHPCDCSLLASGIRHATPPALPAGCVAAPMPGVKKELVAVLLAMPAAVAANKLTYFMCTPPWPTPDVPLVPVETGVVVA
jgi:hypothetical protein